MNLIAAAIIGIAVIVLLIAASVPVPARRLIRHGRVRGRAVRQGVR